MAEQRNATLHRKLHEAMSRQDLEAMKDLIAEDAVFRFSAIGPLSGEYQGRDAVLSVFRQLTEQSGDVQVEDEDFLGSDERSVALGRLRGRRGDKSLDIHMAEFCRWRDGKVAERWAFFDDRQAGHSFFA